MALRRRCRRALGPSGAAKESGLRTGFRRRPCGQQASLPRGATMRSVAMKSPKRSGPISAAKVRLKVKHCRVDHFRHVPSSQGDTNAKSRALLRRSALKVSQRLQLADDVIGRLARHPNPMREFRWPQPVGGGGQENATKWVGWMSVKPAASMSASMRAHARDITSARRRHRAGLRRR